MITVAIAALALALLAWWRRPAHPGLQPEVVKAKVPGVGWKESFLGGSVFAEGRIIAKFQDDMREIQRRNKVNTGSDEYTRGFHAFPHAGIDNAELRMSEEIPELLQVAFLKPGAVFPAIVRLSNASGKVQPDTDKDLRGLAFRVDAPGLGVHDFLATNGEASHARDAWQFMQFASAGAGFALPYLPRKLANIVNKVLFVPRLFWKVGIREGIRMLKTAAGQASRPVQSLATEQYWSRAPFAFGSCAAKFTLVPNQNAARDVGRGERYLREELIEQLKHGPISFDLQLQLWTDDVNTPIEDGSVAWKTPHVVTVGKLVIPQQDLTTEDAEKVRDAVDKLDFNPWYTTAAICPLSSLNRARKKVYKASAGLRLKRDEYYRKPLVFRLVDKVIISFYALVNLAVKWHKLPKYMSSVNLLKFRLLLKEMNLHDTDDPFERMQPNDPPATPADVVNRNAEGKHNSLNWPRMGSAGARMGRNVPLEFTFPDTANLMHPNPCMVSDMLLKRNKGFKPARSLNVLACWWIQLQIHGWFLHDVEVGNDWDIALPEGHRWGKGSLKIRRDVLARQSAEEKRHGMPPAYPNKVVHWWGAGQIYGNDLLTQMRVRTQVHGQIKVGSNRRLLVEANGHPVTGMFENWSIGLYVMHSILALEHNAICQRLATAYPGWDDEQLFQKARLILSALMAKIHTIEWTPGILGHPALDIGMNANWAGLEPARLKQMLGRLSKNETISGIVGSTVDLAGVPFALTEEFSSVYRMHPLVPDIMQFFAAQNGRPIGGTHNMRDLTFAGAHSLFADPNLSIEDVIYSWGITNPGAIALHNHPDFLRDLTTPEWNGKPGQRLDLGALDIFKDRARGVPRYNKFRQLFQRGPVRCFEEVTEGDRDVAAELRAVYGVDARGKDNVDMLDLMPGLYAEPVPQGFGFSDTAFRVFILMASRRLEADRFFTDDFDPMIYTQVGVDWINQNGFASMVLRHFPRLAPALRGVPNPFGPWNSMTGF